MNVDNELKSLEIQKKLVNYQGEDRVIHAAELLKELQADGKTTRDHSTGLSLLDNLIGGGFRRGQLVIISASTGQGKTSFAQTLTKNFVERGEKCFFLSFEVGFQDFAEKMPQGFLDFWTMPPPEKFPDNYKSIDIDYIRVWQKNK